MDTRQGADHDRQLPSVWKVLRRHWSKRIQRQLHRILRDHSLLPVWRDNEEPGMIYLKGEEPKPLPQFKYVETWAGSVVDTYYCDTVEEIQEMIPRSLGQLYDVKVMTMHR